MAGSFPIIGVIGSGAIGTYFGTRLGIGGAHVRFLMRGDLQAVRTRGSVIVHDYLGTAELRPALAFGSAAEVGPVDLAIVALKMTSSGEVERLVRPILGPRTLILTLQNGLGADEFLAGIFGAERIAGGLVFMASKRTGPGEVTAYTKGTVSLGNFGRPPDARIRGLAAQFEAAGVTARAVDNLLEARWNKLVWNIPFNGLSIAEGGITTDQICADPGRAREVRALMGEVQQAARAFGFEISDAYLKGRFDTTPAMGPYQPSSLVDYLAGREVEVEAIWGEPLRRARAIGVDMPRLGDLYARLLAKCPAPSGGG
jgi:2-dehydropantoate 2-reductase